MRAIRNAALVLVLSLPGALAAGPVASASTGSPSLFSPRVPVSAFGLARDWIDPSRLHVTSTLSVGTSSWSSGANALQTTTLSYVFRAPLAMSVSLGNAWGSGTPRGGQSFFLQGFDLAYQPSRSVLLQIQYQNLRSPLQYSHAGFGVPGRWGY